MNWLFKEGSSIQHGLQAFCWMLIHSLWQGLLLAIVAGIVMLLTSKARAVTRYAIITGFFLTFLVICCCTWLYEWNHEVAAGLPTTEVTGLRGISLLQQYGMHEWFGALAQYCSSNAIMIVAIWFAIFCFRCWQMHHAFKYVRRIRTNGHQAPGIDWQHKINTLAQQLNIKGTVTLLESGITKVPVVIGHLKPIIYMPLGLLANLPPEQVEAVLLHELAHIRRKDYLVNLLQHIAESIFFFNPGLMWVSSLLKQEREHCCDDVALAHTGNKKQFIQALISFKEHVLHGASPAMTFPGKKSHLLQRVTRIIHNRNNTLSGGEKIFVLASLLICSVLLATIANKQVLVVSAAMQSKEIYVTELATNNPIEAPLTIQVKQTMPLPKVAVPARKQTIKRPVVKQAVPINNTPDKAQKEVSNDLQPAARDNEKRMMDDYQQAEIRRQQAEKDRQQAMRDRAQADRDREQADRDRAQAEIDRRHAERDRQQAELHRKQAERDRIQADKHREQADRDREQAARNRLQAEKDRQQAEDNRLEADREYRKQFESRQSLPSHK